MRKLHSARNRGLGTPRSDHSASHLTPRNRFSRGAFTLIELLVVVALIAILTSLLAPSLQGLMGVSGRRGGMNTAAAVFEQARLAAIESGVTAYVGFPYKLNNADGFSHLIIFRDPDPNRPSETGRVALTRWQKLPSGVFYELSSAFEDELNDVALPLRTLPRLGASPDFDKIPALAFNRFGQLQGPSEDISLFVGEKVDPAQVGWKGGGSNCFELRIQPLTGRVIVDDAADPNQ